MRFHIPKPLHGWREFAGEVGIIVIGVLLALGAQQMVESIDTQNRADNASSAINAELAVNAGVYEERLLLQPCYQKRLASVDVLLTTARHTGRIPQISYLGTVNARPIEQVAWDAARTSGLLRYMDQNRVAQISAFEPLLGPYQSQTDQEQADWMALNVALTNSPGQISDALLAQITLVFARLAHETSMNGLNATQEYDAIRKLGITTDYRQIFDRPGTQQQLQDQTSKAGICSALVVNGKPFHPESQQTGRTRENSIH